MSQSSINKVNSLYPLFMGIQKVQDFVGVYFFGSGKQNDLKPLGHSFQKLFEVWSCSPVHLVSAVLAKYWKGECGVRHFLETAVHQRFVQIQHQAHLGGTARPEREHWGPGHHVGGQWGQVLDEEVWIKVPVVVVVHLRCPVPI